jgi:hypothetical protein
MPSGPERQQSFLSLSHRQRQKLKIVAIERQNAEGTELHLVVVFPCFLECSALKSEMPSTPSTTASPSMTNCLYLYFSAASTIQG